MILLVVEKMSIRIKTVLEFNRYQQLIFRLRN